MNVSKSKRHFDFYYSSSTPAIMYCCLSSRYEITWIHLFIKNQKKRNIKSVLKFQQQQNMSAIHSQKYLKTLVEKKIQKMECGYNNKYMEILKFFKVIVIVTGLQMLKGKGRVKLHLYMYIDSDFRSSIHTDQDDEFGYP